MGLEEFTEKLKLLDESAKRRKAEAERVWQGYNLEVNALTGIVEARFRKIAREVLNGTGVEIREVRVEYLQPYVSEKLGKKFDLEILNGRKMKNGIEYRIGIDTCLYHCFDQFLSGNKDLRILDFERDYSVDVSIVDCNCGSDHK